MIELNIRIESAGDLDVLLPLLNRMGLKWEQHAAPGSDSPENMEQLLQIIAKGGDATYFGDAADWQRQQRNDRPMPY